MEVVIDAGGAEVDVGVEEFVDEGAEGVGFGEGGELVAEFEILDNFLDVGRGAVEIVFEVGEALLLAGAGFEVRRMNLEVLYKAYSDATQRGP